MTSKPLLAALLIGLGGALALTSPLLARERAMGHGGPSFDFTEVDTNGDGSITAEEFKAHRQARIAGLDADGDGFISQDELVAQMTTHMQERVEAMAAARMTAQDVDGDGKLSAAELAAPRMEGRFFAHADADGDGAVSRDEAEAMQSRMADAKGGHMRKGKHHKGGHGSMPFWGGDHSE